MLYAEERQHAIAALVAERGRLAVTAVAERFGVTTETVRRDLAVLERAGMLRRVHGGAVPAGAPHASSSPGWASGTAPAPRPKRKIAAAALDLLPGTDGSVHPRRRQHHRRPRRRRCPPTAGSTSPPTRCRSPPGCRPRPAVTLHVLGGRVRGITQTAVGDATVRALADLRVDVVVPRHQRHQPPGTASARPTRRRRPPSGRWSRAAQRVIVLADSSKLGREHLVRFAAVDDVDVLVTDGDADPGVVAELETMGIEVLVA